MGPWFDPSNVSFLNGYMVIDESFVEKYGYDTLKVRAPARKIWC